MHHKLLFIKDGGTDKVIDTAMIDKLFEKLSNFKEKKRIRRKEMKVMIDSISEQLCSYYFDEKPSGQQIRELINNRIDSITDTEDKEILIALEGVHREYGNVFSKRYSDHDTDFNRFLEKEVQILSKSITEHSLFQDDVNAKRLRSLLR